MAKKAAKNVTKKGAKAGKITAWDSAPEQCFWVCTGQVAKNLREMADILETMSKEVFSYHVNAEKNDFTKWVAEVFGEEKLAKELGRTKTPKVMARKIKVKIK